jgi:hypothetical protein
VTEAFTKQAGLAPTVVMMVGLYEVVAAAGFDFFDLDFLVGLDVEVGMKKVLFVDEEAMEDRCRELGGAKMESVRLFGVAIVLAASQKHYRMAVDSLNVWKI